MSRRRKKADSMRVHANRRFMERHNIALTDQLHNEIVDTIQCAKAKCIRKQSNRVTVFEIQVDGKDIEVCYDRNRKTLITVLPDKDSIFRYER